MALLKKKPAQPAETQAPAKTAKPAPKKLGRKPTTTPPVKPIWPAPADAKPAFYIFKFRTDSFGFFDPMTLKGERIKGRWDNEAAKRYDLAEFDQMTLRGFASAISGPLFATNQARRLPALQPFMMVLRVIVRKPKTNEEVAAVGVRLVGLGTKVSKKSEMVWLTDKADLVLRKIRRSIRFLPAAFVQAQLPPMRRRSSKEDSSDEE